jgi:hypothetical protein
VLEKVGSFYPTSLQKNKNQGRRFLLPVSFRVVDPINSGGAMVHHFYY